MEYIFLTFQMKMFPTVLQQFPIILPSSIIPYIFNEKHIINREIVYLIFLLYPVNRTYIEVFQIDARGVVAPDLIGRRMPEPGTIRVAIFVRTH